MTGPVAMEDNPAVPTSLKARLLEIYHRLYGRYGPQGWWPGDGPFETILGAILTQNTAWTNVERAIANLKSAQALTPQRLRDMPLAELAQLLRPSGYFNTKARKLKAFAQHLGDKYHDDLAAFLSQELNPLRRELLSIYGIGEETADDILLYAARLPSFVVDTYTRRILTRLGLAPQKNTYAAYQGLFHANLPPDAAMFDEYHALLDRHAKEACRKSPVCDSCCLADLCPAGRMALANTAKALH